MSVRVQWPSSKTGTERKHYLYQREVSSLQWTPELEERAKETFKALFTKYQGESSPLSIQFIRKSNKITVWLSATLQSKIQADLRLTNYFGCFRVEPVYPRSCGELKVRPTPKWAMEYIAALFVRARKEEVVAEVERIRNQLIEKEAQRRLERDQFEVAVRRRMDELTE